MKYGIIGPSNIKHLEELNKKAKEIISKIAETLAEKNYEIIITPDKGSITEYFAQVYLKSGGKKVFEIVPEDDKEFGLSWMNLDIGKHINCQTWRNQPEKLNEETDCLICLGYGVGVLPEIAYTKWFKPKPVYIVKELVSGELPREINNSLDIRYVSVNELRQILLNK